VVDLVATGVLIGPGFDRLEHITLNVNTIVAEGRVMESAEDVINNLIDRNTRVFPS
jgi:hypothetical protein